MLRAIFVVFRLHGMHEMHAIATDDHGVCLSVCLLCGVTLLHCAKTAKRIKILFGVNNLRGPEALW